MKARDGRWRPVLLKYLSTTLIRQVNNLARKHLRRSRPAPDAADRKVVGDGVALEDVSADITGVVTAAARRHSESMIQQALDELDESAREIIVMRGIEQRSNGAIARTLGQMLTAVRKRGVLVARERCEGGAPEKGFPGW